MKLIAYSSSHIFTPNTTHMKKLLVLLIISFTCLGIFAQAPAKMSYQAVMRDNAGNLLGSQAIGMKVSILQGSANGTAVYEENHSPTTNINGLISIEIGGGALISGDFSMIDWGNGPYFLKTESDPTGGSNYTISGSSQMISTPYALYATSAQNAATATTATTVNKTNLQPYQTIHYIIALQGTFPSRSGGSDPGTTLLGEVKMFAGNFAPAGWAFCNGSLLPINSNQALFSLLGTMYGGDGRTTFGLPDLRGRVPMAPGSGPGLSTYTQGQKGGLEDH